MENTETFVKQIFRQGARNLRSDNRFVPPPLAAWTNPYTKQNKKGG